MPPNTNTRLSYEAKGRCMILVNILIYVAYSIILDPSLDSTNLFVTTWIGHMAILLVFTLLSSLSLFGSNKKGNALLFFTGFGTVAFFGLIWGLILAFGIRLT